MSLIGYLLMPFWFQGNWEPMEYTTNFILLETFSQPDSNQTNPHNKPKIKNPKTSLKLVQKKLSPSDNKNLRKPFNFSRLVKKQKEEREK